ncbi:MAG: helix-turn-helix domain-containing protein [Actinomycetota bacterium]|nr:helix-turn-helix domain-containing protein [Actinomycetota bacterium]
MRRVIKLASLYTWRRHGPGWARGRHGGRPPKMTPDRIQLARQLYDSGDYTVEAIAKTSASVDPRSTSTCRRPLAIRAPLDLPIVSRFIRLQLGERGAEQILHLGRAAGSG